MPEKTVNAYQRFILLRSRFVAIALCVALLLCSFALPASAAELDYNDYITNIQVDGDNDIVTVKLPMDSQISLYSLNPFTLQYQADSYRLDFEATAGVSYLLSVFPFRNDLLFLDNIPNGSLFTLTYDFSPIFGVVTKPVHVNSVNYFYASDGSYLDVKQISSDEFGLLSQSFQFSYDKPSGASYGRFEFVWDGITFEESGPKSFLFRELTVVMSISSLYRLQQETGKTNEILAEVEKHLAEQGKTLDEVLQQQQQTNDKLDDMQGSIETLPGQIGDEMQGIIDNEKEQSKGEGNKFVDQILDALPDPSQDVLAALKGLTDATAYTGTDAVLPIPAIVLPGIDGLFPETEIWGGTQFDFGEYISLLPPTLLTLVQALFTIAIVIFCVYELKGIISYCLTLRESKGG